MYDHNQNNKYDELFYFNEYELRGENKTPP